MRLGFARPDHLMLVPDYHPSYGLDDTTRAEVLRLVTVDGLPVKEAAARFNVGQSTVYKWLAAIKETV
jgi:hypothetical protein